MKQTRQFNIVVCALSSAAILLSGCQSGMFKKPDFGKLAFWKNDTLRLASNSSDIPPPSSQFAPDRGESGSATKAEMKANIDQIIADASRSKGSKSSKINNDAMKESNSAGNSKIAESNNEPIRKPYSLDSINPRLANNSVDKKVDSSTPAPSSNDFVLSNKINQFQNKTNEVLNSAQNAVGNTERAVENTANSFAGWKNTLKAGSQGQVQKVSGQLKSQVDGAVANTANTINGLARSTSNSINQSVSNVSNVVDNSFKPSGQVVKNPYSNSSNSKLTTKNSGTDFDSKYKTENPKAKNQPSFGQVTKNKLLQPAPGSSSSDVKQSSFDSSIKKSTAAILQPVGSQAEPATKYPSTSFGEIRPIDSKKQKTISGSFEIPRHLLQGNSSFAPGSTKPLRTNDSSN